jgi:hypothetical protein
VTTPDDAELKQLVIGLASQVYYAVRDGQDPDSPEFAAGFMALIPALANAGSMEWAGHLPQTAEQLKTVLTEVVENATHQTSQRAYKALVYMIVMFNDLARYAEQTSPDIDIPEFLRQAGIRAASDD